MTGTAMAPPGWYPDSERPGGLRWWDGEQWTEHRHDPLSALVADVPAANGRSSPEVAGDARASSAHDGDVSATGGDADAGRDLPPTAGLVVAEEATGTASPEPPDEHEVGADTTETSVPTTVATVAGNGPGTAEPPDDDALAPSPTDGPSPAGASASAQIDVPDALFEEPRRRFFGARRALEDENRQLRRAFETIGVFERRRLQQEVIELRRQAEELDAALRERRAEAHAQLSELRSRVVEMTDRAVLHEVGVTGGPVDPGPGETDERLAELATRIDQMARSGAAVVGAVHADAVHRDDVEPRLVLELHKLVLRSYNIEAEDALRTLRPGNLAEAAQRLEHARSTVARLGALLHIEISDDYHRLRLAELSAVAERLGGASTDTDTDADAEPSESGSPVGSR